MSQLCQQPGDFLDREHMVYCHVLDSAPRHALVEGRVGILNNRHTTSLLDAQEAGGAVVQITREDHPNGPGTITVGRGAEEWI
jgi:hypothetical protein